MPGSDGDHHGVMPDLKKNGLGGRASADKQVKAGAGTGRQEGNGALAKVWPGQTAYEDCGQTGNFT